ncbi:hypothetical protein EYF80_041696 [Liparis tanakae]|uniref:Uncharacterized protein n=1 Tax=Liparis tanakae TaxID=230148 RepID=A0A4Z2G4W1_9TELE|nr:hypothetical protein EYF80_041696 [Liparis tanakae]
MRREGGRERGEQLTRSDTGKRGDLIAQLAKSTGRKQQERLVPSVWPGSLLLLIGITDIWEKEEEDEEDEEEEVLLQSQLENDIQTQ